jgi:hypothetical protein
LFFFFEREITRARAAKPTVSVKGVEGAPVPTAYANSAMKEGEHDIRADVPGRDRALDKEVSSRCCTGICLSRIFFW